MMDDALCWASQARALIFPSQFIVSALQFVSVSRREGLKSAVVNGSLLFTADCRCACAQVPRTSGFEGEG